MSTEDFVPEKLESVLIKTTCSKSGGFNRYTKLPERSIFDNVCYVLSDTLEVKVKESGLLFNRETPWERRPVYFGLFKGFLLIYMKSNSGYALKVPTAHGLRFEGTRVKGRGKKLLYKAVVKIIYNFGQIHLRFKEGDDIRAWRTLLLAAHQFPNTLNSISIDACRKFHWNDASSIVSIHSLQKTPGSGILKNIKYKGDAFTVTRRHVDKETSEREVEEPQEIRELVEDEGVRESSNIGDESCINVEQEDENNLADSKLNSSENDSLFRTCPDILETSYSDCSRKYGEFNADAVVLSSEVDPETSVNPVVCANGEKPSEVLDDEHNTSAPQAVILNKCDISIDSAATTVGVRTPVKLSSRSFKADNNHNVPDLKIHETFAGSKSTGNLKNSELMKFWRSQENVSLEKGAKTEAIPQKQRRVTFNFGSDSGKFKKVYPRMKSPTNFFKTIDETLQGCDESRI